MMDMNVLAAEGAEEAHGPLAFVWVEFVLALVVFGILFFLLKKFVVPSFEKGFFDNFADVTGQPTTLSNNCFAAVGMG